TCEADCGACCGDGRCDPRQGEDCARCEADCGACCGDGACEAARGEACDTCAEDCGDCCGDGLCGGPVRETCATCPQDCGDCCGDGACAIDEDCLSCPDDCRCPIGERCDLQTALCVCAPDCRGAECGDDGCGGLCGLCHAPDVCDLDRQCQRLSLPCGNGMCEVNEGCDSCSEDCFCRIGDICNPMTDQCERCLPNCDGKQCGPNGCGGECGSCAPPGICDAHGLCFLPHGDTCGDDFCGPDEDCGSCPADCGTPGEICQEIPR
ncbi:hypothetical protein KKF91_17995, partial [Myxococcota bacterium]|nr:hypothetical protein [Myxococcota bacterium]